MQLTKLYISTKKHLYTLNKENKKKFHIQLETHEPLTLLNILQTCSKIPNNHKDHRWFLSYIYVVLGASSIIIKLDPFHATFMECMMCFHSCFVSNLFGFLCNLTFMECMMCFHSCFVSNLFGFLCNLTLSQHTLKLLIYTCSCYLSHCFTSKHNKVFIHVFQSHNHILLQSFRNSELWELVTFIISKKRKLFL